MRSKLLCLSRQFHKNYNVTQVAVDQNSFLKIVDLHINEKYQFEKLVYREALLFNYF